MEDFNVNMHATSARHTELYAVSEEDHIFQCFELFSQPIFILRSDLSVVAKNKEADKLLDDSWLGVSNGRLQCNTNKDNHRIRLALPRALAGQKQHFILGSSNNIRRSCTFALLCKNAGTLYLTLQKERKSNTCQIEALAQEFSLTPCEANVLALMIDGLKPKQIAFELDVSVFTIRAHLRTIYAKMNVKGFSQAVMHAVALSS